MSLEFRHGNNTDITVEDGYVHKVTRHVFDSDRAANLALQLEDYAAAFDDEPINTPTLAAVNILPHDSGGSRIEHVLKLCEGPNLCNLKDERLQGATKRVLGQIASMSTMDDGDTLRLPFDATAQNFHIEQGYGILVDIFPPLKRHDDGSFPLENIQYSYSKTRREIIPYTRGTVEGAVLQVLFTAALGDRPQNQALQIVKGVDDWCYDVLPEGLPDHMKDAIRKQIQRRFISHFARLAISDGVSMARKLAGVAPYKEAP